MDGERRTPTDLDRLIAGSKRTAINRRRFLQAAAMAPAAAFLAACERQIGRRPGAGPPEASPRPPDASVKVSWRLMMPTASCSSRGMNLLAMYRKM